MRTSACLVLGDPPASRALPRLGRAKLPMCVSPIRNRFPSGACWAHCQRPDEARLAVWCGESFPTARRSASRNAPDTDHELLPHHASPSQPPTIPFPALSGPASAWSLERQGSRYARPPTAAAPLTHQPRPAFPNVTRKGNAWRCSTSRRLTRATLIRFHNIFPVDGESVSCPLLRLRIFIFFNDFTYPLLSSFIN